MARIAVVSSRLLFEDPVNSLSPATHVGMSSAEERREIEKMELHLEKLAEDYDQQVKNIARFKEQRAEQIETLKRLKGRGITMIGEQDV